MKGMVEKFPELLGLSLDKQIQANLKVSPLMCARLSHSEWKVLPPCWCLPLVRQAPAGLPGAYVGLSVVRVAPSADLVKCAMDWLPHALPRCR